VNSVCRLIGFLNFFHLLKIKSKKKSMSTFHPTRRTGLQLLFLNNVPHNPSKPMKISNLKIVHYCKPAIRHATAAARHIGSAFCLFALACSVLLSQNAHATLLYSDAFNYAPATKLPSPWAGAPTSGQPVVAGDLAYSGLADMGTNMVQINGGTGGTTSGARTDFTGGTTSGSVYVQFLLRLTNGTTGIGTSGTGTPVVELHKNGTSGSYLFSVNLLNNSGNIEASELAVSGIPFGLVSQPLANSATPRLEDHTAYKIAFANGIPRTLVSGGLGATFDLSCDLFAAFNQPTSTADAFASNMFSVTYAVDCNNGNSLPLYPVKVIVSLMAVYGNPSSFTLDATGTQVENTGIPVPPNSPPGGTELGRRIPVANNVFAGAFVAANQTSSFDALLERWDTQLRLRRADGSEIATLVPAYRVDDTARYFANGVANSIDLCYSGLNAAGQLVSDPSLATTIVRQVRNNTKCTTIAPNGPSTPTGQRVKFDAAASPFKDCLRIAFFGADVVKNLTGATLWYTTPFGGNASIVTFANSIKQYVSLADTGALVLGEASAAGPGCQIDTIHVPN